MLNPIEILKDIGYLIAMFAMAALTGIFFGLVSVFAILLSPIWFPIGLIALARDLRTTDNWSEF